MNALQAPVQSVAEEVRPSIPDSTQDNILEQPAPSATPAQSPADGADGAAEASAQPNMRETEPAEYTMPTDTSAHAANPTDESELPVSEEPADGLDPPVTGGHDPGNTGPEDELPEAASPRDKDADSKEMIDGKDATSKDGHADVADAAAAQTLPDSYDPEALRQALKPGQIEPSSVRLDFVAHLTASKRNNLFYLSDTLVLTSAGNTVILFDTLANSMSFLPGLDGGGIGALALHPNGTTFLVAENCKCRCPNAYVYNYSSENGIQLFRVLRSGTERSYSTAAFNHTGDKLATVGSSPDYMLTLWDWQEERVILRTKAFGQEVSAVQSICVL